MKVLVDTPVWSNLLRRKQADEGARSALTSLIQQDRAVLIGPIVQEVLSGIQNPVQFDAIKNALRVYRDSSLDRLDYELAASFSNRCRSAGIQGSPADYLICAFASRRAITVFTFDQDFRRYQAAVDFDLFEY